MKPLTIVSAGQHTRLQAVLELALTGIPYDLSVIGDGPMPDYPIGGFYSPCPAGNMG